MVKVCMTAPYSLNMGAENYLDISKITFYYYT